MLRHLKMEFKRQQASTEAATNMASSFSGIDQQQCQQQVTMVTGCADRETAKHQLGSSNAANTLGRCQEISTDASGSAQKLARRVRGRRSSKPMMEKRRRARINQCLDILKSYVLTDTANLSRLGIDMTARENQDEETIARTILKSSGLINRHRGRKNPNKLEKADILELTVDYVRRLHEQRDELIYSTGQKEQTKLNQPTIYDTTIMQPKQQQHQQQMPMLSPLTLSLPPIERAHIGLQATPPSPPPSSASSSPQPLLSISNVQHHIHHHTSPTTTISSGVLDLSDSNRARVQQQRPSPPLLPSGASGRPAVYEDGMILIESSDGCWRPWHPTTATVAASTH